MAKDTFYFPHDYQATSDPKLMLLLSRCGLRGVGAYWILIEILHQQPTSQIPRQAYHDYLSLYFRFDDDITDTTVQRSFNELEQALIDIGLLVERDGFITSDRVLRNKEERQRRSEQAAEAGKISAKRRGFEVSEDSTTVQRPSTTVQPRKERKGNKIKGNIDQKITSPTGDFHFPAVTLPPNISAEVWNEWVDFRAKEKHKPLTERSVKGQLEFLALQPDANGCIKQSIMQGYQGLFELKGKSNDNGKRKSTVTGDDLAGSYLRHFGKATGDAPGPGGKVE